MLGHLIITGPVIQINKKQCMVAASTAPWIQNTHTQATLEQQRKGVRETDRGGGVLLFMSWQ